MTGRRRTTAGPTQMSCRLPVIDAGGARIQHLPHLCVHPPSPSVSLLFPLTHLPSLPLALPDIQRCHQRDHWRSKCLPLRRCSSRGTNQGVEYSTVEHSTRHEQEGEVTFAEHSPLCIPVGRTVNQKAVPRTYTFCTSYVPDSVCPGPPRLGHGLGTVMTPKRTLWKKEDLVGRGRMKASFPLRHRSQYFRRKAVIIDPVAGPGIELADDDNE